MSPESAMLLELADRWRPRLGPGIRLRIERFQFPIESSLILVLASSARELVVVTRPGLLLAHSRIIGHPRGSMWQFELVHPDCFQQLEAALRQEGILQ